MCGFVYKFCLMYIGRLRNNLVCEEFYNILKIPQSFPVSQTEGKRLYSNPKLEDLHLANQ